MTWGPDDDSLIFAWYTVGNPGLWRVSVSSRKTDRVRGLPRMPSLSQSRGKASGWLTVVRLQTRTYGSTHCRQWPIARPARSADFLHAP